MIKQVKETCLYVNDLQKTRKFYEEVMGFEVIGTRENRHVFFRAGTSVLLCFNPEETRKEDVLPPHYAHGPQHIAFEVDPQQYLKWKSDLRAKGVDIIHEQVWRDRFHSFYFHDPQGHLLEIVETGMWD